MSDALTVEPVQLTADERTMGTLAHVLQLVGGFIAPLIIFLVKRDSRFVSFHALHALLLQALYFLVVILMMGAIFAAVIAGVAFHQPAAVGHNSLPPAFVILFPVIWLGMMGWWIFILIVRSFTESKLGGANGPSIPYLVSWPAGF